MERNRKLRKTFRTAFTRIYNGINEELCKDEQDIHNIQGKLSSLEGKIEELKTLDREIFDFLLDSEADEEELNEEVRLADEYVEKFSRISLAVQSRLIRSRATSPNSNGSVMSKSTAVRTKLRLPTIEFTKFSGDLKDWLPFWAQFKRIDDDENIDDIDKYHYLVQATLANSRARQLVESYPATSENYSKALQSLKSRFGRDDLLIEVYIRELLKLVLSNLNSKVEVSFIYDKLETQLRALETLGVTTDKCSAMLYPLIESCLPEELLRAWQRHSGYEVDAELKDRLDGLMKFLQKEVANEERITLAASGFENSKRPNLQPKVSKSTVFRPKPSYARHTEMMPTAAGLVNPTKSDKLNTKDVKCMFCGSNHLAENCKDSKLTVDEKVKIVGKNGCCFTCLKYGHRSAQCKVRVKCPICGKRHTAVMCRASAAEGSSLSEQPGKESSLANNVHTEVFLQTFLVKIRNQNRERTARALIDTGSQRSYILKNTAKEFGYDIVRKEKLAHALFGGTSTETIEHACYKVRLSDLNNSYACNFDVLDQDIICNDVTTVKPGPWSIELGTLGISVKDGDGPIEVLIGADVAGKLYTEKRYLLSNGLVAMHTLLGWTLMGRTIVEGNDRSSSMAVTSLLSPIDNKSISDLWSLDVLGIKDPVEVKSESSVKSRTMEHFVESVSVENDGRYQVKLPWVDDHPPLPTNLKVAQKRLGNLTNKLNSSGYFSSYQQVLSDWEELGIIEKVNDANLEIGHYLPHRHVIKENSLTTKLRPVFDASAKEKNQPSLNDCLEKGDNLIELIPSILNRFRLHRYGVVADIEKAFLQIGVHMDDRDFLRFLWINEDGQLVVYRHARVVFGVTCSPFMLSAVIKLHLEKTLDLIDSGSLNYSRKVVETLSRSFYVDNCMASFDDFSDLNQFVDQATSVMKDARFCLRSWEYTEIQSFKNDSTLTPILGLNWNKNTDMIELNFENFEFKEPEIVTKRSILSFAHKLFDPIGITCPATLLPKILLQKTWESKIGWDDKVSEELKLLFLDWAKQLEVFSNLKIPRYFGNEIGGNISWTVHCFCDASQDAYAAAVFLRGESNGHTTVQLVQAKSRVAPVKKMTIPRLELLAATIGARLTDNVLKSMGFENVKTFYWTDSTTVLSWIRREDHWGVFVWNRVKEIRSLSNIESWNHVPGHMNPADLPSRGCSPKQLVESKWWEGPQWLRNSSNLWPNQNFSDNCDEKEVSSELRKIKSTTKIMMNSKPEPDCWYYRYFSRFDKVVRLGGWWERLIRLLKQLLRRVLGRASLTYEEFLTVLCSCESVINSRPLTYISEDSHDMEVLTPAMFLNGTKEYGVIDLDQINYTNLSRRWNFKLKLKEDLEQRFRSEYLSQLVLHSKKKKSRQVQVGEIVLLGSDNTKRMDWPLAKIEKILPGKDGNIRLVEMKTSKGTVLRPIQHVFPLELVQQKDNQDGNETFEMEDEQVAEGVGRET
ncbi:uncharacterized protein LOC129003337 [Macrosteles quadrilineatus]|uniref:uncharacterized protein LOC129003337 n=1 Tax=Macrosteles quadrilineatus TaxID=74068 RepID=UPI0023E28442|nr:uncharacterized protein LOC129003337 [Macrosteles quadrilineatus]